MTRPVGVILAGGLATRMGGVDKCLLPLGGQPILTKVIARIQGQVSDLVLNANGDPVRFEGFDLRVRSDSVDGYLGPLAGILAGLDWAHEAGARQLVSVAGDTPFFPHDLVARLQQAAGEAARPIALAATQEQGRMVRHPTFGLWSVDLRDDLRGALAQGVRKVSAWADAHGAVTAMFDTGMFFNVNTPSDLSIAEGLL